MRLLEGQKLRPPEYFNPNATFGGDQVRLWRDALRSRPLAQGTRPRRSVALQITQKHTPRSPKNIRPDHPKTCAQNAHTSPRNGRKLHRHSQYVVRQTARKTLCPPV